MKINDTDEDNNEYKNLITNLNSWVRGHIVRGWLASMTSHTTASLTELIMPAS